MPSFEEDPSIFDLPNLRNQPTCEVLQRTLASLEVKPSSWNSPTQTTFGNNGEATISRYLTGIISNMFEWFEETEGDDADTQREVLWDLASKRMTERCGRSAMGELNRTWTIPTSKKLPELSFNIREPPLTGDNLGLKTWGTAFTIAKRLEYFQREFLTQALQLDSKVLELGAGTGLVGIAASAVWSADVVLTDLPDIQENLEHNITENSALVEAHGGTMCAAILDWKSEDGISGESCQEFEVVVAADSIYDDEHPELVTKMILKYLKRSENSRALVAVPLRDKNTSRMVGDFRNMLKGGNLKVIHEGWEVCRDDWEPVDGEGVKCWWAILGWITLS